MMKDAKDSRSQSDESVDASRELSVDSSGYVLDPAFLPLAHEQSWFVVTNGTKTDIHARVFPPNEESREVKIFSDIRADDARRLVNERNAGIAERSETFKRKGTTSGSAVADNNASPK